ncbi:MAG: hypothetical protein OK457_03025 [Thaumarchaeota archaeon]|nr:hypothetical protein [Nitrososphaerota archaeon]
MKLNRKSSGIAAVAIVIVVVIIIAVVGVGAYVALGSSNTGSTQSTRMTQTASTPPSATSSTVSSSSIPPPVSSTTLSVASSFTSSSSQSSSSSTRSTSSSIQTSVSINASLGYYGNIKDLIGNFSQMEIQYSFGNASQTSNETIQYHVVGHPTINGSMLTEVNVTFFGMAVESQQASNLTALIFYNAAGNITLAQENGQNLTGSMAAFAGFIVLPFNLFLNYQTGFLKNFSAYANFQNQGTATETLGQLSLPVTSYTATQFTYQNFTATSATIKIGHLPNNLEITTLISIVGATGAGVKGTENFEYRLVSATPA